MNTKDLQVTIEALRDYCNHSNYDPKLINALFKELIARERNVSVKLIVSMLKSVREMRYYNLDVLKWLNNNCVNLIQNHRDDEAFAIFSLYTFAQYPEPQLY